MKNKIVPIIIYTLSVIFLILAGKLWIENKKVDSQQELFILTDETFDLDMMLSTSKFETVGNGFKSDTDDFVVIYLITSDGCIPCINEIVAFKKLFNRIGFNGFKVSQIAIVLDQNVKRAEWFVKTTELDLQVLYGFDEKFFPMLQKFGNRLINRQLIIMNNKYDKIFFRSYLRKGLMSTEDEKIEILSFAQKSPWANNHENRVLNYKF